MKFLSPTHAGSIGKFLRRCDLRLTVLLAALILLFAAQAVAQSEATIVGTVTDPSGAAVANANITITNLDTGLSRTINTSGDGQYRRP